MGPFWTRTAAAYRASVSQFSSLLPSLFDSLVDDAAMFPPGNAAAERAVAEHLEHRGSWYHSLIGPLVVPDTALAVVGRQVPEGETLAVSVVNTGGAGGLLALARRSVPGLAVVAVESALRDLDDLAGNAERVAAAATALDPSVAVFVELPYSPAWVSAVEAVEAAGLYGKIRTGGVEPEQYPSPTQLAEQLSVLVEADLGFKATAGLHHAWPNVARNESGQPLSQHGFLNLMLALDAVIDGAGPTPAVEFLGWTERSRIAEAIASWDDARQQRVRRRLRSFGCCGVTDPVQDLVALDLLESPT